MKVFFAHLFTVVMSIMMTSYAAPAKTQYALMNSDTLLYHSPTSAEVIAVLPKTYFIAILETTETHYKASYLDLVGYVKKQDVQTVDYTPKYKYADNVTFTLSNDGQNVNLRQRPEKGDNVTASLPPSVTGTCYGYVMGDALIPQVGGKWYYVKAMLSDAPVTGYIYDAHIQVSPFPDNEIIALPDEPDPSYDDPPLFSLDRAKEIIFISALSLPAVLIMILLFKKPPRDKGKSLRHYKED